MAVHGARQKIHEAVLSWPRWISGSGLIDLMEKFIQRGWPGVTARPHRFDGTEYRLDKRELGHIHGDYLVDIPFPKKVRDEIMKKVISKDGTAIAYDQVGQGQPIILLGGIKPGTNSDRSAATR